ncbi:hypothetical protein CEQ23_25020 [Burkholderia cepacia]|uniref:Secreted protein n=1 Tax=Burkholderia cepacia TaxID=292 RepID=A0ABM6P508_BURCE|nr:hypothetical protein CEQ23_25020 [Burkholderia cepacia]ATF82248.1 hypothetical protein CO711_33845 [Burkholderia cepacia]QCY07988.1 hypothetical protein EJ998_22240 [Burkholderia cepacia ATCC 25416]
MQSSPDHHRSGCLAIRQCCVTSSLLPFTDAHAATRTPHTCRKPDTTGFSRLASELQQGTRASRTHVRSTDQTG